MDWRPVPSRRAGFSLIASLGVISTTGLNLGPDRIMTPEVSPAPNNATPSDGA